MSGAWQNVRNNRRESRTPQNRSSTASPAQASPSQPPKGDFKIVQAPNVWQQKATERQAAAAAVNGPAPVAITPTSSDSYTPINAFDVTAAKAFLGRNAMPATYKGSSSSNTNNNNMLNGQSFLKHLAREISKTEAGG